MFSMNDSIEDVAIAIVDQMSAADIDGIIAEGAYGWRDGVSAMCDDGVEVDTVLIEIEWLAREKHADRRVAP